MAKVLNWVYENIGEVRSVSLPTTLARVAGFEKKSAREYLENELSYTLHQNHRVRGIDYRKTKVFSLLHTLQADLVTLDEVQRLHSSPNMYILLLIRV